MMNFLIHCHAVPIARSNPLHTGHDDQFPYQPKTTNSTQTPKLTQENILEHLNSIRARIATNNETRKPQTTSTLRKDPSTINRSDVGEVKRYNLFLPERAQRQIESVRRKIELQPQRYGDPHYLPQSQMLLLSPGWPSAERYSCCSIPSPVNPSAQCRLHRFCPYCAYQAGRDAQLQFVPAYDKGGWFFMTGSFRGSLGMSMSADAYDWLTHWNIYHSALNLMYEEDSIRGYYLVEELAVNHIHQVSVLPHIHALIDSDTLDAGMMLEAVQAIKVSETVTYARLEPDVVMEPINSQRSLMDRVRYLFKPINLVTAYETDWRNICHTNPQAATRLNSHTTDLVLGYSQINRRRKKMAAKGTLNVKCKQHIGTPIKLRHRFKPLLKQLQAETRQYIEQPECDEDLTIKPTLTQYE